MKHKDQNENSQIGRLKSLIDASKLLNSTFDLDKLLGIILDLTVSNLNAERGTIYLVDVERNELWSKVLKGSEALEIRLPIGQGVAGQVALTGETINIEDVSRDARFDRSFDKKSGFVTKTMLCMPMKNSEGKNIGVFQVLNKVDGFFENDDILFLSGFSEHAALAIENAKLHAEIVENERVEKELFIASEIQKKILPKSLPNLPGCTIAGLADPCKTVGGDYYDVIKLGDKKYALVIADVTGKGIPAALMVSTLHASLRAYLESVSSIVDLVKKLNEVICLDSVEGSFITFFIGVINLSDRTISFVNAGHNSPILLSKDGKLVELLASGAPLGVMEGMDFYEDKLSLNSEDLLVLYSDGVTEAMNRKGKPFGDDAFRKSLYKYFSMPATAVVDGIMNDVNLHVVREPYSDDLTLLVLKCSEI